MKMMILKQELGSEKYVVISKKCEMRSEKSKVKSQKLEVRKRLLRRENRKETKQTIIL